MLSSLRSKILGYQKPWEKPFKKRQENCYNKSQVISNLGQKMKLRKKLRHGQHLQVPTIQQNEMKPMQPF